MIYFSPDTEQPWFFQSPHARELFRYLFQQNAYTKGETDAVLKGYAKLIILKI